MPDFHDLFISAIFTLTSFFPIIVGAILVIGISRRNSGAERSGKAHRSAGQVQTTAQAEYDLYEQSERSATGADGQLKRSTVGRSMGVERAEEGWRTEQAESGPALPNMHSAVKASGRDMRKAYRGIGMGRSGAHGVESIMDDRKGDWLAKQLKEEATLGRLSKYDLGAAHDISCDARKLKRSHRHDNTIDNGEL